MNDDLPPTRIHCQTCHRDSYAPDVVIVAQMIATLGELAWVNLWRGTCTLCGVINLTHCSDHTADLLTEAGFPLIVIEPPVEIQPDCGPFTLDDVIDAHQAWADDTLFWHDFEAAS